jgi:hypothetical protein
VLGVFNNAATEESLPLPSGSWTDARTAETVSGSAAVGPHGWRYLRRN